MFRTYKFCQKRHRETCFDQQRYRNIKNSLTLIIDDIEIVYEIKFDCSIVHYILPIRE